MRHLSSTVRGVAVSLACALAACSSHGGTLPSAPPQTQTHETQVQFNIKIPQATSQSGARKPEYISTATASASIAVQQGTAPATTTTIKCSPGTCSGAVSAPIGTDTFAVSLLDSSSNVLSKGQMTATIVAGQANTVNVSFGGVIQSIKVSALQGAFTSGVASSLGIVVNAADADHYTIVGPQPYATPITLSLSDASGTTTLSASQVNTPEDPVQLKYNGGAGFSSATISASVSGNNAVAVTPVTVGSGGGSGSITSLQGYKEVALVGDGSTEGSSINPFHGMAMGPDGRLWVSFQGAAQSGLYAIDVTSGAATFYATGTTVPAAIGAVGKYVAVIDEDHNSGYGDLVLYNTDGTFAQRYPGPQSGGTVQATGIIQGSDGNAYVTRASLISELVVSRGVWNTYTVPYSTCSQLGNAPWTVGSDGNLYNTCDATDFVRFGVGSGSIQTVSIAANPYADSLMSQPALGSDGLLYAIHALGDPNTHASLGTALGVSAGTGGPATMYTYPSGLAYPFQVLASAQGKMAFLTQDSSKTYSSVVEFFDQTAHTFSEYSVPDTSFIASTIGTTLRDASGVPIGIAFSETPTAIGVYAP